MSTCHACLFPDNLVAILVLQPMGKWPASAMPIIADAVSFEFDGINVTAQHVMAQTAPLMRLLAFYDQFIKDYHDSHVSAY